MLVAILVACSAQAESEDMCHCGEHLVGENLRNETPPLFIREWHEVDEEFLDKFVNMQGLTYIEHGDFDTLMPRVERWTSGNQQLDYHTMLIWSDQVLYDIRIVALGFNDTDDETRFYVRHELLYISWPMQPYSLLMINAGLLHYLIPRMGITFTDVYGNHHRMLIQESMAGGCVPLFHLAIHDESHFSLWDDTTQPLPFVAEDAGWYHVYGLGDPIRLDPREGQSSVHFFGRYYDVPGLYDEFVIGGASLTQDSIRVSLVVARNEIIMEHTDGPLGEPAGPIIRFEYVPGHGLTGEIEHEPFTFYYDEHPPLYYDMPDEVAISFAQLLLQAFELINDYHKAFM